MLPLKQSTSVPSLRSVLLSIWFSQQNLLAKSIKSLNANFSQMMLCQLELSRNSAMILIWVKVPLSWSIIWTMFEVSAAEHIDFSATCGKCERIPPGFFSAGTQQSSKYKTCFPWYNQHLYQIWGLSCWSYGFLSKVLLVNKCRPYVHSEL